MTIWCGMIDDQSSALWSHSKTLCKYDLFEAGLHLRCNSQSGRGSISSMNRPLCARWQLIEGVQIWHLNILHNFCVCIAILDLVRDQLQWMAHWAQTFNKRRIYFWISIEFHENCDQFQSILLRGGLRCNFEFRRGLISMNGAHTPLAVNKRRREIYKE